jgi:2-haloacid dehalogenase
VPPLGTRHDSTISAYTGSTGFPNLKEATVESVRTCVFDAYGTLLDVHAAVMKNAADVGECAEALSALWRQRQLEYSWTRTLMGRYVNFWKLTEEALTFALRTYKVETRAGLKERLLRAYFELDAYPDASSTLQTLKAQGYETAVLSNGSYDMLQAALSASNLTTLVDECLSVDELQVYKPDPRVYQFTCDRLNVRPREVCFVSSNAWDLAGAGAFGFLTVRINRLGSPLEYEFSPLRHQLKSLSELSPFLESLRAKSA